MRSVPGATAFFADPVFAVQDSVFNWSQFQVKPCPFFDGLQVMGIIF